MKQFFAKKSNVAIVVILAVLLLAGSVGGVYAYSVHTQNVQAQHEAARAEARRAEIDADLAVAAESVSILYSDDTFSFLADDISAEALQEAAGKLTVVYDYMENDADMTEEQKAEYAAQAIELTAAQAMHDIATLYGSLNDFEGTAAVDSVVYLLDPDDAVYAVIDSIGKRLEEIKGDKPEFYNLYSENLTKAKQELEEMQAAIDAVAALFDEEGNLVDAVDDEQLEQTQALLDALQKHKLKAELATQLQDATEQYNARQEAAALQAQANAQRAGNTSTGTSAGSTGSNAPTGGGNTAPATTAPVVPAPAPEAPAANEEPYIVSGSIGNGGLFDTMEAANQWAQDTYLNTRDEDGRSVYSGYQVINILYSNGTWKYSINMY